MIALPRADAARTTAIGDSITSATTPMSAEVTITDSAPRGQRLFRRARSFEPHPSTTLGGGGALADKFYSVGGQRADQLHKGVDIAANNAVACFHTLNSWQ